MPQRRYHTALYIFRRDLRCHDNSALNLALAEADAVLPCFIFDPRQIQPHPYQSLPALQFMLASLNELQLEFQTLGSALTFFHDLPANVINQTFARQRIQAVYCNRDYTPFSRHRDHELAMACKDLGIDFYSVSDYLLTEPEHVTKNNGTPYQVFTPFYNNARRLPVALPKPLTNSHFIGASADVSVALTALTEHITQPNQNPADIPAGGRRSALTILGQLHEHKNYQNQRDFPYLAATSKLSAHLKFGTCSVREAYYAIVQQLGEDHPLLRQLYWRDFFSHIAFHFPHVFGKAFYSKYDRMPWVENLATFQRWRDGTTGFPIVDAGMRELNATGYMHNRVRMIVASFLTKDLHISWRWGERYFAQQLVDYDPAVNNGNWQWAASTGCDAQPYYRIFNPWLQQQKFDSDCQYIYRWMPELSALSPDIIHNWQHKHTGSAYPAPMLDHGVESKIAKQRYLECLNKQP